ncbi:MAG: hypothetical protein SGI91_07215 [Alphaproteobacteria bacterium]|jgi:hypothetical protein|nr:hypothetical protein [Alphaproteobacteria bacterium]
MSASEHNAVPAHRLLPSLALAAIAGMLFVRALFQPFFAGCTLDRSAAAIGAAAAEFALSPAALVVLPLVLLPIALLAALSAIAFRWRLLHLWAAFTASAAAIAASLFAMSLFDPAIVGGEPRQHRCYLT